MGVVLTVSVVVFVVFALTDWGGFIYPLLEEGSPSVGALILAGTVLALGLVFVFVRRIIIVERQTVAVETLQHDLKEIQRVGKIGYWELTPDGGIHWSRELYELFGFHVPPDDINQAYDRIHPDDREKARDQIDHLWDKGGTIEDEERLLLPGGQQRWLRYVCHAQKDPAGNVVRLYGTTQDITERKQAERTDHLFRQLIDRLDDVYWIGNLLHPGVQFSASAEETTGYSLETLARGPETIAKIIHPEDRDRVFGKMTQTTEGAIAEETFRIVRSDGDVLWAYARSWPVPGGGGESYGIIRDITAEKELEETREARLREGELFERLLDNLEDAYFVVDLKLDRITISAAAQAIFGRTPQEFSKDPDLWNKLVVEEDREIAAQSHRHVMTGQKADTVTHIRHADGSIRTIHTISWPRTEDGDVVGIIGVIRDVTAEEENTRLKELDEMKALFMNAAAHELNTPLTPLKLQIAVLEKESPGDRKVEIIKRNVYRMEVLVRDLLDASRLQSDRLKYDIQEDMDLTHLLQDVAAGASLQAKEDGKTWQTKIDPDLRLRGDPHRLMQVFTNLTNNAIKFTPEGGQITLTAKEEGDAVHVTVKDTGMGLEPDEIDGLFVPFHQFHRGKTGVHKGTGLGLFISHGIVEHHEGRIDVESEGEGKGSTFTVVLPMKNTAKSVDSTSSGEESG